MNRVYALILDPSAFVRQGIRECLEQGAYQAVGEAQTLNEALQLLAVQSVDVIILGATFSEEEELAIARSLHRDFPTIKIILITEYSADPLFQVDAAASGVDALLRRRVSYAECWTTLEQVMAGHLLVSREILTAANQPIVLSDRQREILKLWAEQKTDQEIANQLVIMPNTARTHARNILRKLQVHTRQMAVRRGRRRGLL